MDRKDHVRVFDLVGLSGDKSEEITTAEWSVLQATPRELELIMSGLKVLAAEVSVRDLTSKDTYPHGHPSAMREEGMPPLQNEIAFLLRNLATPTDTVKHHESEAAAAWRINSYQACNK